MNTGQQTIEQIRAKIDELDEKLVELLGERAKLAYRIGRLKLKNSLSFYDSKREREIVERIAAINNGAFPEKSLFSIFQEVFFACRSVQQKETVAYLGPRGTFSYLAALRHFGKEHRFHPTVSIEEVFVEVAKDRCHYGIVPIENSTEGTVNLTLDAFLKYDLSISGEVYQEVQLDLVNQSGQVSDIKLIYSHPQPLAQCRQWLHENMTHAPVQDVSSTAVAAQLAAENPEAAAIAPDIAAQLYNLRVAARRIEDYVGNTTRFVVLSKDNPEPTGRDKTSVLFGVQDRPGSLVDILRLLSEQNINMSKIESRPKKGERWQYLFFVDLEGHREDAKVKEALERIFRECSYFKW
ncbi:MAG: prephenate dehydratase, partial [Pseudomonadota bacterium]